MLKDLKSNFPEPSFGQNTAFTVLKGCDDYIDRVSKVSLKSDLFTKTTLITLDFGDAYTETSILGLQHSITKIGSKLMYDPDHIDLMRKLVKLVFSNCYFYTPSGLYRQTKGMPMGDYSSRDSLDIVLVCSELKILSISRSIPMDIHLFCRLVDDVSVICQGNFNHVLELIYTMINEYPCMPLNFQVSFGYSRFLDLHIYNFMDSKENYKLTYSLAYKDNSTFAYTPCFSNIHDKYKHAVVPISLHRAHTRCTSQSDVQHHISFMSKMVQSRNQDPEVVRQKTRRFFQKSHGTRELKTPADHRKTTPVLFDSVNLRHQFMKKKVDKYFEPNLRVVFKSKQKLSSEVCPKRLVISKLSLRNK